MDLEKKKRRQSLKVIISESIMVLAVIITVIILAFLVSGYWINSDFEVERQGMLQVLSVPTGADVIIDDEAAWMQRTNTSKVLISGEHTIVLKKEGYDSWSKTINITEGLLYRIHYPRLFLEDRSSEKVLSTTGTTMSTISPDHNSLILINNTTKWTLIDLTKEQSESKDLNISNLFSSISLAGGASNGLFTGEIKDIKWDYSGSHALFEVKNGDNLEWVLLDIKNPDKSINLTKEFDSIFSNIEILDNSSNTLLAIKDSNLYKIDVSARHISTVLVKDVLDFDHYDDEILFVASESTDEKEQTFLPEYKITDDETDADTDNKYYIGFTKIGSDKITKIKSVSENTKAVLSRFYDEKYITILEDTKLSTYKTEDYAKVGDFSLTFSPEHIEVGHNGEFIMTYKDNSVATLDMEANLVREWQFEGENFGWLDNNMIYTVKDGTLIVYDFDGLNRREIAKNVSAHFSVGITENKWLYYFSDDSLVREWLITR